MSLRRVGHVHDFVSQRIRAQNVLEEALGPHARFGFASKTGHGLDTLKRGNEILML